MSKARNISMGLVVLVTILASSHHSSKLADAESTETANREIASESAIEEKTVSNKSTAESELEAEKKHSPHHKKSNHAKKSQ